MAEINLDKYLDLLIGDTSWHGETNHDRRARENLGTVDRVLTDLEHMYVDTMLRIREHHNWEHGNASAEQLHKEAEEIFGRHMRTLAVFLNEQVSDMCLWADKQPYCDDSFSSSNSLYALWLATIADLPIAPEEDGRVYRFWADCDEIACRAKADADEVYAAIKPLIPTIKEYQYDRQKDDPIALWYIAYYEK